MRGVIQDIVNALSIGSLFALYGLGIALIFGIMRLVNFAHGELIMSGAYAAVLLSGHGLLVAIAGAVFVPVALALIIERIAFRPVRSAPAATLLVTSFAVSFSLQSLATVLFGTLPRSANLAPGLQTSIDILGVTVTKLDLVTLLVTGLLLTGIHTLLTRTALGMQMRAAAEDFTTARLMGVNGNRVIAWAFAISGLLAGAASFLLVAESGQASATMGLVPLLFGFVATVIGGLGSLIGAVVGGYIVGALTTLLQITLPENLRPYRDAMVFGCVLVLLVLRPQGLLASVSVRTRV